MKYFVLFSLIFINACAPTYPKQALYIDEPAGAKPKNAEKQIRQYLDRTLRDPDSLKQFAASAPYEGTCNIMGHYLNRWIVPFEYNAKNGFGGYVGVSSHYALFKDEVLMSISDNPAFCQ